MENDLPRLTPRHRQTLQLLAQDLAYKQISAEMGISINTVRTNLREIYRRLGVNSRLSAIRIFEKGAWVAS